MGAAPDAALAAVRSVLEEAVAAGWIGGHLDEHVRHSLAFADVVEGLLDEAPGVPQLLDLGSGGGIPGLVLGARFPTVHLVLLDTAAKRTAFLVDAVERLGWTGRATVVTGRAEDEGRRGPWRGAVDVVVARSFGPPAVVAECASGFLRVGGHLVVSEPPGSAGERWAADDALATLGLARDRHPVGFQVLRQVAPCPDRYPRKAGIPAKRPLFAG